MEKEQITALLFVFICSVSDIRKKKIPLMVIIVFGTVSVLFLAAGEERPWKEALYALAPGMGLLALAFCTGEGIGYGDGFAVLVLGLLVGALWCLTAVFLGFFLCAVWSLFLLALKKVNGKSRLPFVPFLAVGLGVVLFGFA